MTPGQGRSEVLIGALYPVRGHKDPGKRFSIISNDFKFWDYRRGRRNNVETQRV